jgi:hypothetical protein
MRAVSKYLLDKTYPPAWLNAQEVTLSAVQRDQSPGNPRSFGPGRITKMR